MEAPEVLRTARRHAGLSQRGLAAAAGVSRSTIEAVEAGRRTPSWSVLQAVLSATGLELTVDRACDPLSAHARRHLHRSLSSRLHLVLGGDGRPRWSAPPPGWADLDRLALHGPVFLTGRSAVGLWLPGLDTGRVRVGWAPRVPAAELSCPVLDVGTEPLPRDCTVTVPLPVRSLRTPPPGLLALHPDCGPWRRSLRSAARALDEGATVDPAGRRAPAHVEPRREDDAWRLLFSRRWSMRLRPPDRLDGRGWRLDDEVGLRQWVERRAVRG